MTRDSIEEIIQGWRNDARAVRLEVKRGNYIDQTSRVCRTTAARTFQGCANRLARLLRELRKAGEK